MKFTAEGFVLRAFCNALGDVAMNQVRTGPVNAFLGGPDPGRVTATWTKKYSVITGFYRFALARDHVRTSPLPNRAPKLTEPDFIPYIYSQQELKRMLDAVPAACSSNKVAVEAGTYRTLLLLLYGAGLRLSEALSLTVADVDLDQAILCVRGTKFYKTRLVPLCMDLTFALAQYVGDHLSSRIRRSFACATVIGSASRRRAALSGACVSSRIWRVMAAPGINLDCMIFATRPPFIASLRGTAAVDLHFMLPRLATFRVTSILPARSATSRSPLNFWTKQARALSAMHWAQLLEINHDQRASSRFLGTSISSRASRWRAQPFHQHTAKL